MREPRSSRRSACLIAFLAESPRQVFSRSQLLEHVWDSSADYQDPSTVTVSVGLDHSLVDHADKLVEAGVSEFTFGLNGPDYDVDSLKPWLEWAGR